MPDESTTPTDEELRSIVAECDLFILRGTSPSYAFWELAATHNEVFRRTAKYLRQTLPESPSDPIEPQQLRVCASFLLAD